MKKQYVKIIINVLERRDFQHDWDMLKLARSIAERLQLDFEDFFYELAGLLWQEKQAKIKLKTRNSSTGRYSYYYNTLVYAEAREKRGWTD